DRRHFPRPLRRVLRRSKPGRPLGEAPERQQVVENDHPVADPRNVAANPPPRPESAQRTPGLGDGQGHEVRGFSWEQKKKNNGNANWNPKFLSKITRLRFLHWCFFFYGRFVPSFGCLFPCHSKKNLKYILFERKI
ncbi:MAG: hypothetical protein BJ554DRAFT_3433, partial [Olpidium bornovanus]